MIDPIQQTRALDPEDPGREARAQRILDAASNLIRRRGYRATTVDDIAREAGVGKGTLYLHWESREALFTALITREKVAMAEDIRQRIGRDPAGATLRGLLKHAALALMQRPLLKAAVLSDTEVFGKFVQRQQSSALSTEIMVGFTNYFQSLGDQGLVRADLSLKEQVTIFSSIFLGFLLAAPLLPDAFKPADEELAELMAETGHRALEPRDPAPGKALQSASQTLTQYLDASVARAQQTLTASQPVEPAPDVPDKRPPARPRGRKGGRSKKLGTPELVAEARRMYADPGRSIGEICEALGISRASLYRYVRDGQ